MSPPTDPDPAGAPFTVSGPADRRTLAAAALVLEITTAAAGERDLDAILRAALDRLHGVIDFTGGSIALVEGDELCIRTAVGPYAEQALGQRLRRGPSASWNVITSARPHRFDDLATAGRRATSDAAGDGIRSWLAVPILRHGSPIGLLEVDSTSPSAFFVEDERLLGTVAQALAGPIDLAARYGEEQRSRQLRDAFTGVVSHELRTPITTIYGMSRVLRQRLDTMDHEAIRQAVDDIEAEADRLRRLTEDLLVLSRAEGGRLQLAAEPLLIGHIVRRAAEAEMARWPAHTLVLVVSPDLPLVAGEELSMEQVVRNLVSNAVKYSPQGSIVEVSVVPESDGAAIRVADQGAGIPAEAEPRLFELFFRAPEAMRQSSGAGIGLFVCRQLVESMGGSITGSNRPAGGAEFRVWLPALAEE